jgi:galactose mutarotase-like enzyme
MNAETLTLRNDLLQIEILPAFGGKISSLRSVRSEEEFLLPPINGYRSVSPSASFSEGDGGGFDECLPSVAGCECVASEASVPDHGDLWRLNWHVDSQDGAITLHADAISRPLRLTRRATLHGSSLILDYDLLNLSDLPATWLWSAHPLLRVNAGDRIILPHEIEEVTVDYSAAGVFDRNSSIAWPHARSASGAMLDLSKIGEKDGVTAHKLFARMNNSGWSALYRHKTGEGLVLRFDPSALPFLGLWICSGAWPEMGIEKQYTVALEPTTSNVDSLVSAERNGTARRLGAHEHCQWRLELQLLGVSSPLNFEDFRASASASTPEPVAYS